MESDERWSLRTDGDVVVVEFPHGTGLTPAESEALLDRWRAVTADRTVGAVMLVVRTSRPCSDAGRRALRESTQIAVARDVDRFAVVGERSKRRFLMRTIAVEGVDTEAFADDDAALQWAKRPSAAAPTT